MLQKRNNERILKMSETNTIGQAEVAEKLGGASATDNAGQGIVSADGKVDVLAVRAILLKIAKTKAGGMAFSRTKLTEAVFAEVRSRMSLETDAVLPADVRFQLIGEVKRIAASWGEHVASLGYVMHRASKEKAVLVAGDNARVARHITATYQKELSLSEQIGDARLKIAAIETVIEKLDADQTASGKPLRLDDAKKAERRAGYVKTLVRWQAAKAAAEDRLAMVGEATK